MDTTATPARGGEPEISVTARLFALYREAAGGDRLDVQVPAGTTVGDLWPHLLGRAPGLQRADGMRAATAYAVNGTWAKAGQALRHGDEVAFLPPVSGG